MTPDIPRLRAHAIAHTLFRPTTLRAAMNRVGFVQADPISAPACAQDLILRHRVRNYRAGDLERRYESLGLEEDLHYAYGFLTRASWQFVRTAYPQRLPKFEKAVLAAVCRLGPTHPRNLDEHFGRKQVRNTWGGVSQATKQALERLHHQGFLRIARRDNGIRIYEQSPDFDDKLSPDERLRRHVLLAARVLSPVRGKLLQLLAGHFRDKRATDHRMMIKRLLQTGELAQEKIDGVDYLWVPNGRTPEEPPHCVRFLAPFDPLVWDRERFEHLWQWTYRFEAYTPPAKRIRGYYAMPLLWGDDVIGWANAQVIEQKLKVKLGFVHRRPRDQAFRHAAETETASMAAFLGLPASAWTLAT